jgi:hypothetical protein
MEANASAGCSTLLGVLLTAGCAALLVGSFVSPLEVRKNDRMARHPIDKVWHQVQRMARHQIDKVWHQVQAERLRVRNGQLGTYVCVCLATAALSTI